MAVHDMQEILDDVLLEDLPEVIKKLPIPSHVHVRVTIETLEEAPQQTPTPPGDAELRFLDEMARLPIAVDLPEDLAHQHDHYLYGLPKKS